MINSSNNSDSGITARVFQSILKFMNDNDSGVYVIMTSNDVSQLPPEFTRSGRLDMMWYFGLPHADEREEIFNIHLRKHNKKFNRALMQIAVEESDDFTGAEIEQAVKNIIRQAYLRSLKDGNKEITPQDVRIGARFVVPINKSSKERIAALERYCQGRARRTDAESRTISIVSGGSAEISTDNTDSMEDGFLDF